MKIQYLILALVMAMPITASANPHGSSGGSRPGPSGHITTSRPAPAAPTVRHQNYPVSKSYSPQHGYNNGEYNHQHSYSNWNGYHGWNGSGYYHNYWGYRNYNGWGWNHGVAWNSNPYYYGGGFWGPFTVGVLFGSVINYSSQVIYPAYQVAPSSPGATLLNNYGLQQTECGPPNLVVLWGPNDSVICTFPNDRVTAGNYQISLDNLTIISR